MDENSLANVENIKVSDDEKALMRELDVDMMKNMTDFQSGARRVQELMETINNAKEEIERLKTVISSRAGSAEALKKIYDTQMTHLRKKYSANDGWRYDVKDGVFAKGDGGKPGSDR